MYLWNVFFDFFASGGAVMWPILAVSLAVWIRGIDTYLSLGRLRAARRRFLAAVGQHSTTAAQVSTGHRVYDWLLIQITSVGPAHISFDHAYREFLLSVMPEIERGFASMNAWISVAPLLGLLGTVAGMIQTFQVITRFGIGNPHLMSEGISVALLTTQAGLTAAFPGLLLNNFLLSRKNRLAADILKDGEALGTGLSTGRLSTGKPAL